LKNTAYRRAIEALQAAIRPEHEVLGAQQTWKKRNQYDQLEWDRRPG
jgi:hypothetical protein